MPTTTESTAKTTTTTTEAPERAVSTTTTEFAPSSIEGEIEAAYLKSWDVYAEAVYNLELDEEAFAEVFGGDVLAVRREEVAQRIREGRSAHVLVEHNYTIDVLDPGAALIVDRYANHQVLITADTKEPIEDDPNEVVVDAFTLRLEAGHWVVVRQLRMN